VRKQTSGFFDENRRQIRLTILVDLRTKQGENRVVSSVGSESVRTIAYLRISTGGQDLNTQRFTILNYAQQHGLVIDTFVESQSSSRRTIGERGLRTVLDQLHTGDTLLVNELSRLGRSVGQIIQLLDQLLKKEVTLVAIKENLTLRDTPAIQTKVMVTLFSLFAEIERDLIAERTKEGLAAARAKGRQIGRPKGVLGTSKLTGRETAIQDLLAKTVSKASIAKIMGVSRSTLHHFICSRHLA
jgi:DNA invertase Pin-like site-specific DNA recombinase